MQRKAKYKPLLFTTTMRSPERLKGFLSVLKEYNGQVLDNRLAKKIAGEIIKRGLYRPTKLSVGVKQKLKEKTFLNSREVSKILKDNPQQHKEAGFEKGWASRFSLTSCLFFTFNSGFSMSYQYFNILFLDSCFRRNDGTCRNDGK